MPFDALGSTDFGDRTWPGATLSPFPPFIKEHELLEWQEGRGQRGREPPRLTYERSLLAERLEGPCSHPARLHMGTERAEES